MSTLLRRHRALIILLCSVGLLSLLPVYEMLRYVGAAWHGVPLSYIDDNYYYVRMKEVVDGYPLLGNPYFFEHRTDIAPAFLLPDWVSALPMLLGAPLVVAVTFNFTSWALVFALLSFTLLRQLLPRSWAAVGSLFAFTQVYLLILRPVSMQLVFPVFLLFIIAFLIWLKDPEKREGKLLLAASAALSCYDYAYLAQVLIAFLLLVAIHFLLKKEYRILRSLIIAGVVAGVFIIPVALFTLKQLYSPFYFATMVRTGLVYTHLPTTLVLKIFVWVGALAALLLLVTRWLHPTNEDARKFSFFYSLLGVALVLVAGSNLITGKELETAQHIERFVTLWLALGSFIALLQLWFGRERFVGLTFVRKSILVIAALVVLLGNYSYAGNLGVFLYPADRVAFAKESQEYIPAFDYLDKAEVTPKVVWVGTHSTLSAILPIYTKHYLLFSGVGILQLGSDEEMQERYLVASYLSSTTSVASIAADTGNFAGVAKAHHIANTENRKVKLCNILHLSRLGISCGVLVDPISLNTPTAEEMYLKYQEDIAPNIVAEMKKFHVSYIMKDKFEDTDFYPERLTDITKVYEDARFVIYRVN